MVTWRLLEEISKVSLFPIYIGWEAQFRFLKKFMGRNLKSILCEFRNGGSRFFIDIDEWDVLAKEGLEKVKKDPDFLAQTSKNIMHYTDELIDFTQTVFDADLSKKTNEELIELYSIFKEKYSWQYASVMLSPIIDFVKPYLSTALNEYLEQRIKDKKLSRTRAEYFFVLTTPLKLTLMKKQEKSFLQVQEKIEVNAKAKALFKKPVKEIASKLKDFPALNKLIDKHYKTYCWIPFGYEGPAWDKDYFLDSWRHNLKHKTSAKKKLKEFEKQLQDLKKKQKQFEKELALDKEHRFLFKAAREMLWSKDYRRNMQTKSYYHINKLVEETSKRLFITKTQTKFLTFEDVRDALRAGKADADLLNKRIDHSIYIVLNAKIPGKILVGKEAKALAKKLPTEAGKNITELLGTTACPGKVKGIVKHVYFREDIAKMNEGDILIAFSTHPELVPAMKRAGAIVTDMGGLTSHAAIVSRELNIPCVVGTRTATKVFKDGDLVEVDATHGVIKKVKK
jgi:phosphohistidine swiveling domain-containing protein